MKKYIIFIILLVFSLTFLYSVNISAYSNEERLALIQASQALAEENEISPLNRPQLAILVTNFGSQNQEANPGARFEITIPETRGILSFMMEVIYFRQTGSLAVFPSLKSVFFAEKNMSPYLGAGKEITAAANYQVITGLELFNNFFVEGKFINDGGYLTDSELFFAAGFQFSF